MPEHKLLLPLDGKPVLLHAVETAVQAGIGKVVVVLGREASTLRSVLKHQPCMLIENPDFKTGMGSSFRMAVDHLQDCSSLIFMLADMPFVSPETLQLLSEVDAPMASCWYGEVQAPPVKFQQHLFPELRNLQEGAKPLFQKHRAQVKLLQRPERELLDLDTPEDYQRAISRFSVR
ncbi:hypothetical protein DC3_48520 [Deinococcus cellulosilyticus NBRC 106333 = KACC 11606]|uniref:MobA-like NTP transferase domain-containing protein n=2 Tax=Deinococcus cellulosilyticus TaxID=401558 RepID=A0A511N9I5_DEIC1|nr:hypothetical protein DC3_48520 [Deinococcus cellulosilyticus NBRC 106333 = KACC 11606]